MVKYLLWLTFVVGVWLIVSPWFLGYASPGAQWHDLIAGVVIAALAYLGMREGSQWAHWLAGLAGLWLIVSSIWIFGLESPNLVRWNELVTGVLALVFAAAIVISQHEYPWGKRVAG
jgi:hypothetical protein